MQTDMHRQTAWEMEQRTLGGALTRTIRWANMVNKSLRGTSLLATGG